MTVALVVGTTETAAIEGVSAAGVDPEAMRHTPAADAEVVVEGRPVAAPALPVSPTGCPTPALFTRAVREAVGFEVLVVDAGLGAEVGVPTVSVGGHPGGDVRDADPVPGAARVFEAARERGRAVADDELVVGESIPGGTTTALGALAALGEPFGVSSSLPANPLALKREVVATGLSASGIRRGDLAGRPHAAVRRMGDPVLPAVAGLAAGALAAGTAVTLGGGTQMLAAAALLDHAGVDGSPTVATTPFVAADDSVDVRGAAADLGVELVVTDPGFDRSDHDAMDRYERGEAKEGAGMGGALALADRRGVPMATVRDRAADLYDRLVGYHAA